MEINSKTLALVIIGSFFFLYLTDTFRQPSFQNRMKSFLNSTMGNSSHSIIKWIEEKTNSIAGLVSFSSVTILSSFPSYLREPKKVLFAFGLGVAGLFLKWNNIVNLGGFNITQPIAPGDTQESNNENKAN